MPESFDQKTDSTSLRLDDYCFYSAAALFWRREKVWELRSMGYPIDEIVEILKQKRPDIRISHGTVCRDLKAKAQEIKASFQNYIEKELPTRHRLAVTGLEKIIRESWRIYSTSDNEPKIQLMALNTISDATMKLQAILGDPDKIEKAIKMASQINNKTIIITEKQKQQQQHNKDTDIADVKSSLQCVSNTDKEGDVSASNNTKIVKDFQKQDEDDDNNNDKDPVVGIEVLNEDTSER